MKDTMRIAGVYRESIVDGPGLRFAVFTQGCNHACLNCHNPETWDFNGGYDCSFEKMLNAIDENPLIDGVTLSGGDPMYQPESCFYFFKEIKKRNLSTLIYTGFTFEELIEMSKDDPYILKTLELTDILIDGPYIDEKRDLTLLFRGSSNQRVIDVQKSLKEGKIYLDERYIV